MFVVHGTKKFLDRVGGQAAEPGDRSTTALGPWYATPLFWRPQVVLFVNERTLLPVLVRFAPATTVLVRFAGTLAIVLRAHGSEERFVEDEMAEMTEARVAKTKNRSVIGIMNEFAFLSGHYADDSRDLMELSVKLARTPCGPLYATHGSPDRELVAFVAEHGG